MAWYNKGLDYNYLKNYKKAIACYDKATRIDPENVDYWFQKGLSYYNLKNYKKAIACYDKATNLNPKQEKAW